MQSLKKRNSTLSVSSLNYSVNCLNIGIFCTQLLPARVVLFINEWQVKYTKFSQISTFSFINHTQF